MTRINSNREFFKIEPERVIAVLRLLKVDDITQQVERTIESDVTAADKQSAQSLKEARRPRMNFHDLGIPNGSILVSVDGRHQSTVVDEKKVEFSGVKCSLTAATRRMLELPEDYALQPSPYWTFNGRTVKEIYEDFHTTEDD